MTLAIQVAQPIRLKPVSQNAKQDMAWQVRGRPLPEYILPTVSKVTNVEITQTRNLDVDRLLILWRRTDLYARHGVQDDGRLARRGPD